MTENGIVNGSEIGIGIEIATETEIVSVKGIATGTAVIEIKTETGSETAIEIEIVTETGIGNETIVGGEKKQTENVDHDQDLEITLKRDTMTTTKMSYETMQIIDKRIKSIGENHEAEAEKGDIEDQSFYFCICP